MARQRPSLNKKPPFNSPHVPAILLAVAWSRLASVAQIHALTSFGRKGQPLASLERLLPRLVACGLLREVQASSDDRRGRPLKAYHLAGGGCRSLGVDPDRANKLADMFRRAGQIENALAMTEVTLNRLSNGWSRVLDGDRFSVVRAWVVADAAKRHVDVSDTNKLVGLRKMSDDSPFSRAGLVFTRGGTVAAPAELEVVYGVTSAAQARTDLRTFPQMYGCQGVWKVGIVGPNSAFLQAQRTAAKLFGRRQQRVQVTHVGADFRVRSRTLATATYPEERKILAVRDHHVPTWVGPTFATALTAAGFTDLTHVTLPAVVRDEPAPVVAPVPELTLRRFLDPTAPVAPAVAVTPEPAAPPTHGVAFLRGILTRPEPGAKPKKARAW